MVTPDRVKKILAGKLATFGFLAAVGCAALIFASGCGEVTTTPGQVSTGAKSDAPPPVAAEQPAEKPTETAPETPTPVPGDPDTGGYDHSFLWKPISDSDRNLAILTPYQMNFKTLTVGKETRTSVGRSNGHRQTWRFSMPGARYGKNVKVTAKAVNGPDKVWIVPDGAKRWTSR